MRPQSSALCLVVASRSALTRHAASIPNMDNQAENQTPYDCKWRTRSTFKTKSKDGRARQSKRQKTRLDTQGVSYIAKVLGPVLSLMTCAALYRRFSFVCQCPFSAQIAVGISILWSYPIRSTPCQRYDLHPWRPLCLGAED